MHEVSGEAMRVTAELNSGYHEPEEINRLWETGTLNETKVDDFRHLHERTRYK